MYNDTITLIRYTTGRDKIGNPTKEKELRELWCSVRSATRYEYYNHGVADRVPEYVVTINAFEYAGEVECIFRDKEYNISRIYEADRDNLELTLERKVGK